jgi:hypothetical protein
VAKVPPSVEKPIAQKQPTKNILEKSPELEDAESDDFLIVDRWQEAFERLSGDKQEILKGMGFDKPKSANVASTITDLIDAVNAKQEECENKFWRVTVGGKEIVFRDYTTSILGWLEKAGDIAIQFAPPQASLPWDLVKSLMQVRKLHLQLLRGDVELCSRDRSPSTRVSKCAPYSRPPSE